MESLKNDENSRIKYINELLPDLKINSYKFLNAGANSEAFLINNEFIFRFTTRKSVYEDYEFEQQILNAINLYITSTKIPKIEIFSNDKIFFSKHKIIEGIDFYKSKLDLPAKEKIAKSLAKFYFELHSIDINNFDFLKDRKFHLEEYDICKNIEKLEEILGNDFIEKNINEKMDYLYKCQNDFNEMDNILCHGDIHEENIIINNCDLSGIIDFGNAFIGNRNIDFSSLLEYDIDFGLYVIREYEKLMNKNLNIKFIFYLQQIRCYSVLLDFVKINNEKYIKMFKTYIKNLKEAEIKNKINF